MIKFFKRKMFLGILVIVFSVVGCSSTKVGERPPDSKPENFDFIYNYGVGAKNQLDTVRDLYTKDMVISPSVTTELKLSDEEMNDIYEAMMDINILNYPENFSPESNGRMTPYQTYSIKIIINNKEKTIYWEDENYTETKEAVQLRNLFKKIGNIIISREEYKKLPQAKGAYA